MFTVSAPVTRAAGQVARDTTLANGLQVYVAENHRLPEATVTVAVRTGAFTQEPSQDGLAHLYEHLLFRGYPRGQAAFDRETGFIEAGYNGETTVDYVDYFLELPSARATDAVKILARLVRNARFSESDLKAERPIVLDELARDASTPLSRFERQVQERLWGTSWSRLDVGGDSATVSALSLATLQSQFTRYYVPNNMALIVSGDVSTAAIWKAAADAFGDWGRAPEAPAPPTAYPPLQQSSFVLIAAPVTDVTIVIASQGPAHSPADSDAVPVLMMAAVLNNPVSAFQARLTGSGLFQSVHCSYVGHRYDGTIELRARVSADHAPDAVVKLLNEVSVLDAMSGIGEEDLGFALRATTVGEAIDDQEVTGLAEALAYWWGGPGLGAYDAFDRRLAAVKLADVTRVAGAYVSSKPHVIGILGPRAALEAVRARLVAGSKGGRP